MLMSFQTASRKPVDIKDNGAGTLIAMLPPGSILLVDLNGCGREDTVTVHDDGILLATVKGVSRFEVALVVTHDGCIAVNVNGEDTTTQRYEKTGE